MRKAVALAALLVPLLAVPGAAAQTVAPAASTSTRAASNVMAQDGPGATSHYDLARKDCFGTARNTTSKVWYTVANGVLSDVYYPTIDNTNVETLQYIVTDGATFTDLQTRDMTYSVSLPDPKSMRCQVTTQAKSGKYTIVSQYMTDPSTQTLLISVRFTPLVGTLDDYHVYVRLDPTINGNGGGGTPNGGGDNGNTVPSDGHTVPVACDMNTKSQAANRDYAQPVCSALDSDVPWLQVTNGFAGQASDALTQLDASHTITAPTTQAVNGNIVQTTQVDLQRSQGSFTIALGFGQDSAQAAQATHATLHFRPVKDIEHEFDVHWHDYDASLLAPPFSMNGVSKDQWQALVNEYYLSLMAVKASEDKKFPGALVASIASPWGQAVAANDPNNLFFGSYREVFARDVYEAWTGLFTAGDNQTARDVVKFLFEHQQLPDGSMPRNSLLNGKVAPDTFNTQLDECSYPIIMAWQLGLEDWTIYTEHIKPAANFIISHGPSFGPERWEEQSGFSPSTISAEVAGLISAADIAEANHDPVSAAIWRGVADSWQRQLESWTVTSNGPLASHPYFIRLSKTGDPNAAISYNVGNGGPTLDQRTVIDQGFLELVRLGLVPPTDTAVVESLPVVDATIMSTTATGPGWHRYNGDGYGDNSNGQPWPPTFKGMGHLWPLLSEERGEYNLDSGNPGGAVQMLQAMQGGSSGVGLIPEQVWELPDLPPSPFGTDPTVASIGFQNGHPAGSAAPLTWAAGVYGRLVNDLSTGKLLEQPRNTVHRYVNHQQAETLLNVTSPVNGSSVATNQVIVAGRSVPGNSITVAATNIDTSFQTTTARTTAKDVTGNFQVPMTITGGTTVFTIVATTPSGATQAQTGVTVVFDFTAGTVILDQTDPDNDDNGPGNYAYPTASDFHPGAFDIEEFLVIDDGTNTTFKVKTRDLSPTFGSSLGAQLVDVYVHDPSATPADTSTAASFPQRNYTIANSGAWNRLLEVQGFGQRYVDAHGNTLGTITISANSISRFITFSVPDASLGHPTSGWGFSVVLTGQDGFSPDQARNFAPTPQPFLFGVCATASTDPHCTVDPNTVPKAVDVMTPSGVQQSDELDYTIHNPVAIQPINAP